MYKPDWRIGWGLASTSVALLAGGLVWLNYGSSGAHVSKDYEDCADEARSNSSSNGEYARSITHCGERFAGRRKANGGYTYFDFMQNRTFDIAGPNPTDDERKKIDHTYMNFLGAQRREALLSDLAKAQANQEQTVFEHGRQDVGPPLALTPKIPLPLKRPAFERARYCEDGSISCSWAKLSMAVKNAFASSAGTNR
jgi:hypothetical protein